MGIWQGAFGKLVGYSEYFLTLSYSSEGSPAILTSLTQNCLKLCNYTLISLQTPSCILWWHWLFKTKPWSSTGLKIRPQSAFTALWALLPLQTILLSDLVGYDNLLQIVISVWRTFFQIWSAPNTIAVCSGLDWQHCSLRTYHSVYVKGNPLRM
jgi:hypothetical protein